jgi:HAMP domain-containing protein
MRLLIRFSAIFTLIFGTGMLIAGFLTYRRLQDDARTEVRDQAQLMMEAMRGVRSYTNLQLKPILIPLEERDKTFLPQTVPAFAATENFGYIRLHFPEYSYKEAALNPTNPRDRAADWEADIVSSFRNSSSLQQLTGERDSPTGRSLFFAQPIRAAADCLPCHSQPERAPAAMLAQYGPSNGFGWKLNEVIAAQIISVPMTVPLEIAHDAFRQLLTDLTLIFVLGLAVLNLTLYFMIARPVGRLSHMADQISLGQLDVPELPAEGHDEVAQLASSFNRMRRSLVTAMKMLGEQGG